MVMAQEFLAKNGMPAWTAIERVPEGGETTDFKAAFDHFDPPVSTRILGRRTAPFQTFRIPYRAPHGFTPRS